MAISPEDLLGTPSGYATPDQLSQVQQYANALMKGGQRDQPITSPWQGVRMMADTLSGNIMRNRMGQQQMANLGLDAQTRGVQPPPGSQPSAMAPHPMGQAGPPQASAGGLDPQTARTFKLESGNDPNNVTGSNQGWGQFGPAERRKYGITDPTNLGQNVSATHQETAGNTAALTKALGRPPTPGEVYLAHQQGLAGATALLTNPNVPAWQAVRKFYPSDAIAQKAIAGNPPGGGHFDPNNPAGAFTGAWVKQFESRMPQGGPQGGPPMATGGQSADLSGHIGGTGSPPAGAPQAPPGAMAANTARPPAGGAGEPPMPQVGNPAMGSQYMESRPQVSPEMMQRIWRSPTISPEEKQMYYQQYIQQNQPVQAEGPGGHWIMPGGGKGQPIWVPGLQKFEEEAAGAKTTTMGTIQPGQGGQFGFQGLPGASGIGGQPPPQATPPQPASQAAAPPSPQGAPAPSGATPPPQGGAGAPTPLGVMPPGAPQPSPQPAQAGDTGSRLNALANFGLGVKQRGELNTEDVKKYTENSNATIQAGTQAQQGLPMIQMAKQAVQNGNFYSGIGANAVVDFKKLKAAIGDDPNAAAANEIFEKGMAGDVLSQLRSKLQGLGQVRLAEIDLLSRATANKYNTPAANLAVLNIIERSYNQMGGLSKVADDYSSTANPPTNAGLNVALKKYLTENPTFSADEIKDFNKTFDLDKKGVEPTTYTNSKAGQPAQKTTPPASGYDLTHPDLVPSIDEEMKRRGLK